MSRSDIETINSTSLEVLEKTGVDVKNPEVISLLKEAGCSVEGNRVRIPSASVVSALKSAPSSFKLQAADTTLTIGENEVLFNPGSSALYFLDRETILLRKSLTQDLVDLVRVTEHLDHIGAQSTALVPSDIPERIADLYRLYVILKYSRKPIITGAFSIQGLLDMQQMLKVKSEDHAEPRAIFDCCPVSPLVWDKIASQNLMDCARLGIPAQVVPAPLLGATSPITITGTLVQFNAEVLSGIVIAQIVNRGCPVVYGGAPMVLDQRHATPSIGAIEAIITACSAAEIGKHYSLPTHSYLGLSDATVVDAQSGSESASGLLLGAMAGISIISGPGMLANTNCQSLEKLVIDNEICGSAHRLTHETFWDLPEVVVGLIDSVSPGGSFIGKKHTRQHLRQEHFFPSEVLSRLSPEMSAGSSARDVASRARNEVNTILEAPLEHVLPVHMEKDLDSIFNEILKRERINPSEITALG